MKSYYYLRLFHPQNYLPLEEYVGRNGILESRDDLDELLIFRTRDEAGEYLDQIKDQYPNRGIQICFHLGRDQASSMPGVIKI